MKILIPAVELTAIIDASNTISTIVSGWVNTEPFVINYADLLNSTEGTLALYAKVDAQGNVEIEFKTAFILDYCNHSVKLVRKFSGVFFKVKKFIKFAEKEERAFLLRWM